MLRRMKMSKPFDLKAVMEGKPVVFEPVEEAKEAGVDGMYVLDTASMNMIVFYGKDALTSKVATDLTGLEVSVNRKLQAVMAPEKVMIERWFNLCKDQYERRDGVSVSSGYPTQELADHAAALSDKRLGPARKVTFEVEL